MPKTDYKERQAEKLDRAQELADKRKSDSEQSFEHSRKLGQMIPMGQPILVGHYSEKGHRAHLKKIDNAMRKGIENSKKAEYFENKVKNLENNYAISQDDPEATKRLKEKIQALENDRIKVKALKIIPRDYSFSELDMRSVSLTSLGAEIRRCKQRLEQLKKLDSVEAQEWKNNLITLEVNKDENRIMIYFPGKPDEETRKKLKQNGWRWSPINSAWQSYIHDYKIEWAKREILGMPEDVKMKLMTMDEADPGLFIYHENFKRSTEKLRELFKSPLVDDKIKTVIIHILNDRGVNVE